MSANLLDCSANLEGFDSKCLFEIIENKFNTKFIHQDKIGVSVAEHSMMFAVLMGFKNIFFQGVDLPTQFYRAILDSKKYY